MLIRVSIAKGSMTVKIKQNRFSTTIAVIIHWVSGTDSCLQMCKEFSV